MVCEKCQEYKKKIGKYKNQLDENNKMLDKLSQLLDKARNGIKDKDDAILKLNEKNLQLQKQIEKLKHRDVVLPLRASKPKAKADQNITFKFNTQRKQNNAPSYYYIEPELERMKEINKLNLKDAENNYKCAKQWEQCAKELQCENKKLKNKLAEQKQEFNNYFTNKDNAINSYIINGIQHQNDRGIDLFGVFKK